MKQQLLPLAFLASLSLSASAAVTVVASTSGSVISSGGGNGQTLSGFDPAGGTKLVVTVSGEANGGGRTVDSITFGGVAMTEAVFVGDTVAGNIQVTAIYYLDNPGTTAGDIQVTWSGNVNGTGFGVLSLAGAAAGGPEVTAGGDGLSTSITPLTTDSLLVSSFVANGNATMTVDAPLTTLLASNDIGSAVGAAGYQTLTDLSEQTPTFTTGGGRPAIAAAVFPMIPEPSTALLSALGVLGLLRRRR